MEDTLGFLAHRLGQQIDAAVEKKLPYGATVRQLTVLQAVSGLEICNQSHLVRNTGIDRSTLSDMVRRLVERGWLHRRRSRSDARAYNVTLSTEGARVLRQLSKVQHQVELEILENIQEPEQSAFLDSLKGLIEALEEEFLSE